jgi:hypothetical protein
LPASILMLRPATSPGHAASSSGLIPTLLSQLIDSLMSLLLLRQKVLLWAREARHALVVTRVAAPIVALTLNMGSRG